MKRYLKKKTNIFLVYSGAHLLEKNIVFSNLAMLMMEVNEQTTDHNEATVPESLAGGTRGSAQQTWGNRLEILNICRKTGTMGSRLFHTHT